MKKKELEIATTTYTVAYKKGYSQCQEDMAIKIAELKIICQEYSKDVKALNDMLNSLNKQD